MSYPGLQKPDLGLHSLSLVTKDKVVDAGFGSFLKEWIVKTRRKVIKSRTSKPVLYVAKDIVFGAANPTQPRPAEWFASFRASRASCTVERWSPYVAERVYTKLEPYELGRALYHLAQRRGYLSNRKTGTEKMVRKCKVLPS